MPYFKFVEPTDNGAAVGGKEEEQAMMPCGRGGKPGRERRLLCWQFGSLQSQVERQFGNIFLGFGLFCSVEE